MRKNPTYYVMLSLLICSMLLWPPDTSADGIWSSIRLPVPQRDVDRQYLGLSKGDTFTLSQIGARLIIIQVYSMYCPICQREAERVNSLFELLSGRNKISGKTKLLGIGAGNSEFEVDFYRKTYNVMFPLFADGEYTVHKRLGEVRTPYFYMLQKDEQGNLRQVYAKAGGFTSPEAFLDLIMERLK